MDRRTIDHADGSYADLLYVDMDQMQEVAEHCADLRRHGLTGTNDIRHLACIPAELVEKYCNDRGIPFSQFMRDTDEQTRMLNDPALAAFRIHTGRAG